MNSETRERPPALTKYPTAGFRELLSLALPLILSLFSGSFMLFCDRLFLNEFSLEAFEGSVTAGYLCNLFQHPIMRIAVMAQVFVGLYMGSNRKERIGNSVWQMIWLSLFSMVITLPISQFISPFFFDDTPVRSEAMAYFQPMMFANFLFPLGVTLSSYFIGQGRTSLTVTITVLTQGLNIALDYFFIFGKGGFFAPMGIFGASIATVISQFAYCTVLFIAFMRKQERDRFGTDEFQLSTDMFWEQLRTGAPRAVARIILLTAWVAISRVMTLKGGDYLLVLSVGGTLILFLQFINDGMLQAMVTIASHLIGSKRYQNIWKLVRSAFLTLFLTTSLLAIPYLVFPEATIGLFKKNITSAASIAVLTRSCVWIWFFFFSYGVSVIGMSLITASRDVTFHLLTTPLLWCTSFLPVYVGMNHLGWSPDVLWLIMGIESMILSAIYFARATKEKWKTHAFEPALEKKSDFP